MLSGLQEKCSDRSEWGGAGKKGVLRRLNESALVKFHSTATLSSTQAATEDDPEGEKGRGQRGTSGKDG